VLITSTRNISSRARPSLINVSYSAVFTYTIEAALILPLPRTNLRTFFFLREKRRGSLSLIFLFFFTYRRVGSNGGRGGGGRRKGGSNRKTLSIGVFIKTILEL
jgi:hypothetical protein